MGLTVGEWMTLFAGIVGAAVALGIVWLAFQETSRAWTVGRGEQSPVDRSVPAAAWWFVPLAADTAANAGGEECAGGSYDGGDGDGD